MVYFFAYLLGVTVFNIFFPTKISGLNNIPKKGGFIIASNHISYIDPPLVGYPCSLRGRKLNYVAKDTLFKNNFFNFFLYRLGAIPIKRDSADKSAIKEILRRLQKGEGVLIFPQGTRLSTMDENIVEAGIGLIATKAGVPVIPAFIKGSDKVFPPGKKYICPSRITITLGKPSSFDPSDSYLNIARQIMRGIIALSLD